MKKQVKTKREVEKANAEIETPGNVDFVEISMPNEELDKLAHKYSAILDQRNDPILRKRMIRRQERLLKKVFKVASQVLTDSQLNVFVMRFVYGLQDKEIAKQIGTTQMYITRALKGSIKKIQKRLRVRVSLAEFSRGRKQDESNL